MIWLCFFPKFVLGIGALTLLLRHEMDLIAYAATLGLSAFHIAVSFRMLNQVTDHYFSRNPLKLD